jgi:hypothetical protein
MFSRGRERLRCGRERPTGGARTSWRGARTAEGGGTHGSAEGAHGLGGAHGCHANVFRRTDGRTDDRTMAAGASVTWMHCSVLSEVTWG